MNSTSIYGVAIAYDAVYNEFSVRGIHVGLRRLLCNKYSGDDDVLLIVQKGHDVVMHDWRK